MPPARFEPAMPANEWPQTHDLDRAATGISLLLSLLLLLIHKLVLLSLLVRLKIKRPSPKETNVLNNIYRTPQKREVGDVTCMCHLLVFSRLRI